LSIRKKYLEQNIYPHTPDEVHSSKPELFARVAKAVSEQESNFTSHDIAEITHVNTNRTKMYLLTLFRLGKIIKVTKKNNKKSVTVYRVNDSSKY
jgi:transcription initiation factor IIE alpha subunit